MQKCAKILFGKHNFKSFCNINDDTTTFERTIFNIQILQDNEYIKRVKRDDRKTAQGNSGYLS